MASGTFSEDYLQRKIVALNDLQICRCPVIQGKFNFEIKANFIEIFLKRKHICMRQIEQLSTNYGLVASMSPLSSRILQKCTCVFQKRICRIL